MAATFFSRQNHLEGGSAALALRPIGADELEALWGLVQAYGAEIHAGPGRADGLAAWQPLKDILSEAAGLGRWAGAPAGGAQTDARILETFEGYEAGQGGGVEPEDAHFYAQLFRIPAREECSLRRLLQVAYNSGQLSASGALARLGEKDEGWPELYEARGLGRLGAYCAAAGGTFSAPAGLGEAVRALAQGRA